MLTNVEVVVNAQRFLAFVFVFCGFSLLAGEMLRAQHRGPTAEVPNFLKGDEIPKGYDHDWNLGPTGARGWIYSLNYFRHRGADSTDASLKPSISDFPMQCFFGVRWQATASSSGP